MISQFLGVGFGEGWGVKGIVIYRILERVTIYIMSCRIYRFFYLVANKKLFSDFSCSAKMKEIGNKVESWFVAAVAFL